MTSRLSTLRNPLALLAAMLLAGALCRCAAQELAESPESPDVRIAGTLSTKPLLLTLIHATKEKCNIVSAIATAASSAEVIDVVATGTFAIGVIAREVTGADRSRYPDVQLVTTPVGMEVVALGVSDDLWQAGFHSITREKMRDIYEQKITNWRDAGGPDEKIALFNFPPGQGIWEIFAEWLYGDNRKAPFPRVEKVASSEDARDSLEFNSGGIAPLAAMAVDDKNCHALGIKLADGTAAFPVDKDIAAKRYTIVRPLLAITAGKPALLVRKVIEFITGPDGQRLVKKAGGFGAAAVPPEQTPQYNAY